MHKFFVPQENINDGIAVIEGEDVKHIYKVLRLEEGAQVIINDCRGTEYLGEITVIDKKQVHLKIIESLEQNNESPIDIFLF